MTKYLHKYLAGLSIAALLLCASPLPVLADDATSTPPVSDQSATSTPDQTTNTAPDQTASTTPDQTLSLQDTQSTSTPVTVVATGDASSTANAGNAANSNDTTTDAASSTVSNTNDATTTTDTSSVADTGNNSAGGGSGSSLVVTGDSSASANVINVINTNITNSTGLLAFFNAIYGKGQAGSGWDFRNLDLSYFNGPQQSAPASTSCSLSSCGSSLTVQNNNGATVTNSVVVRSNTGDNTASSTGGSATVGTGDAYAAANVLNVVNTNLTNSNYLLLSLNNFGNLAGDITLPNADFFSSVLHTALSGSLAVHNTNSASVSNNVNATADTGNNNASSTDSGGTVVTGDAHSAASSENIVNTNLTQSGKVYLLVNIFGNWTGNIQGLPPGIGWVRTPTGIALTSDSGDFSALAAGPTNASSTNDAQVTNDVSVYALTGNNSASGAQGATVATGDAYAAANVVNIVNTNVIGQNWLMGMLNVFGNWSGNLAFGHPDLWIGAVAQANDPTRPGDTVTYHFTVANHGDADATDVVLSASYDPALLAFVGGGTSWNLGDIPKGESRDFSYTATAGSVPAGQSVEAPLTATVTSGETDNNTTDNTDKVSLIISSPDQGTGINVQYTPDPVLHVSKTASADTVTIPGSVNYTIEVTNDGGPAYDATLYDTLTDESGHVVHQESWPLDEIDNGDDITVSYTMQYGTSTAPGRYTNTAQVKAIGRNPSLDPFYGAFSDSPVATSTVTVLGGGEVLGAETEAPVCGAYLTSYITKGGDNDSTQVRRLQFFLRGFDHAPLVPNGVYDQATIAAVEHFQTEYAADILTPWGMTKPTPNVYYTTQAKVNELWCQGVASFPLSKNQQSEILSYHDRGAQVPALAHAKKPVAAPVEVDATSTPVADTGPAPSRSWTWSLLNAVLSFGAYKADAAGR